MRPWLHCDGANVRVLHPERFEGCQRYQSLVLAETLTGEARLEEQGARVGRIQDAVFGFHPLVRKLHPGLQRF